MVVANTQVDLAALKRAPAELRRSLPTATAAIPWPTWWRLRACS